MPISQMHKLHPRPAAAEGRMAQELGLLPFGMDEGVSQREVLMSQAESTSGRKCPGEMHRPSRVIVV